MSSTDFPTGQGDQYIAPGIDEWQQNNPYNQETGVYEGSGWVPPFAIAPHVQQRHNLGVWNYRQQLMGRGIDELRRGMYGGVQYMQGATGLLQSYRPGGGAALEAGIYGQTASAMQNAGAALGSAYFQQASMTEPLDYMFDYRREQDWQQQRRLNRQQEWNNALGAASIYAQLVSGGSGTNFSTQRNGGGGGGNQGRTPGPGQGSGETGFGGYGGMGGGQGSNAPAGASASTLQTEGGNSTLGAPGQQQDGQQPGGRKQLDPNAIGGSQGMGQSPAGETSGPGGGTGAGAGGGSAFSAGGGAGVGAAAGGAGGDFSPRSMAAGATLGIPVEAGPATQVFLHNYVADLYESDSFYRTYAAAIDVRWRERLNGRVA